MSGTAEMIELARQRLAAARAQSSSASAVFASSEESYNAAQHQLVATKIIYDNAQESLKSVLVLFYHVHL